MSFNKKPQNPNSNSNSNSNWILLLLVVFMAIFAVGVYNEKMKPAALSSPGWFVNAITQTNIISNDPDLGAAKFIIDVTVGGGQNVVGTLDQADFKTKLPEITVKNPLKIQMGDIKEYITYPIRNEGQLFRYTFVYKDPVDIWGAKCDPAPKMCFPINTDRIGFGFDRVLIVDKTYGGSYGKLDSAQVGWKGNIIMSINNIPLKAGEIGSAEATGSIDFTTAAGEWVGRAAWTGSLVTGAAPPAPNLYYATYTQYYNVWHIAQGALFEGTDGYFLKYTLAEAGLREESKKVQDSLQYDPDKVYTPCKDTSCSYVVNLVLASNDRLDDFVDNNSKISYGALTASTAQSIQNPVAATETVPINQNMGNVVTELPVTITHQNFQIIVKAASLSVEINVGKPEIVNLEVPKFASGDETGVARVTIKNVGTASGRFAATFVDASGTFAPSSNVLSSAITLDAGETGTVNVYIDHGTSAIPQNKWATMRVYDVNKPSNYAERGFQISMTSPKQCQPGASRTDKGIVYLCRDDGMGESIVLTCLEGILRLDPVFTETGGYACEEVKKTDGKKDDGTVTEDGKTIKVVIKKGIFVDWYQSPLVTLFGILVLIELGLGIAKVQQMKKKR